MPSGFLPDMVAALLHRANLHRCFAVIAMFTMGFCLGCRPTPDPAEKDTPVVDALTRIREQVRAGNVLAAEREVTNALVENPQDVPLQLAAAEIATHLKKWPVAAEHYRALAQQAPEDQKVMLLLNAAQSAARGQRLFDSMSDLEAVLKRSPSETTAHRELAGLQCAVGLEWEATEHLRFLARKGEAGVAELIVLADRVHPQTDEAWIADAMQACPNDLRPTIGQARLAAAKDDWQRVKTICQNILAKHDSFFPAWVLLGRALWEVGDQTGWQAWHAQAFSQAASHPDYWFTMGLVAETQGEITRAAYGYSHCLERDPFHREATARLAPLLLSLEQEAEATRTGLHAERLDELTEQVTGFLAWKRDSQAAAVKVSKSMIALGRPWEALGWAKIATQLKQDPDPQARAHLQYCLQQVRSETPFLVPDQMPHAWLEDLQKVWSQQNMDSFELAVSSGSTANSPTWNHASAPFRFEDEAKQRGIDFEFHNGDDPNKPGFWIYQSYGGGVAALDYDLNGFPDLYFGEAGCEPLAKSGPLQDRLYRNHGGHFEDVSWLSQAIDDRLTQGVGVGDFNEDGFPDLFIANIGENRLYRNNGDGTFQDVTESAGLHGARWTSCVCIADLDGDHVCDLLEINYCENERTFTVPCFGGHDHKRPQTCSPTAFAPEPDRFWKGQGDGTFIDQSDSVMPTSHPGRGLGLLVTDFDGVPGLEVFVANDMSANHFWKCGPAPWQEQATLRGLANDARGRAQACMGIAAGDPNQDGRLDLLVTNFEKENNAFYVQSRPGFFEDRAASEGIAAPSFAPLGFGTQFADFDGDQRLDALVANGHVIDLDPQDGEFAMYPQAFTYDRGWHERVRKNLGTYFESKHVGRAMALVDVQSDGWPEVVINHLVEPTALLVNQDHKSNLPLTFELVATNTARDCIGARVEIVQAGKSHVRWRTAGDGFQCSNQPLLWYSMKPNEPCTAHVTWPSGHQQTFESIVPGHYLLIEGRGNAILRQPYSITK